MERRFTAKIKKKLILITENMTEEERRPYLDEWDIPEEEFQLLRARLYKYGIVGLQITRAGQVRKMEKINEC